MERLDIKADEVNEWLTSRKKLPKDWGPKLRGIQASQMKLEEHKSVSSYLSCQSKMDSLLRSDIDQSKNWRGNYQSEVLYSWDRLTQLYHRDNLYLGECAKALAQLANYEVPALKRQLKNLEKRLLENRTKQETILENISKNKRSYEAMCGSLGISGDFPDLELKALTRNLPVLYLNLINYLQSDSFSELLDYYKEISVQNHGVVPELPVVGSLRKYSGEIDIEKLQDQYALPVENTTVEIADDVLEPVQVPSEGEWVIEKIDEGNEGVEIEDFPVSDRQIRTELINELLELQAFAQTANQYRSSIEDALKMIKPIQEFVVYHEQPQAITRIINKLKAFKDDFLNDQLSALRRSDDDSRINAQQTNAQLKELLQEAQQLVKVLESSIPPLFSGKVSIKIVGDIVRDIRNLN